MQVWRERLIGKRVHEGIIEDVLEATTTSTKKFGITTKHAAAQMLWDTEFNNAEGERVRFDCALNPHTSTPRTRSS
jgi:hypothetical protein